MVKNPINRRRLEQIDERDREVRETARGLALAKVTTFERWSLPDLGQFRWEQFKRLRETQV